MAQILHGECGACAHVQDGEFPGRVGDAADNDAALGQVRADSMEIMGEVRFDAVGDGIEAVGGGVDRQTDAGKQERASLRVDRG